MNDFLFDKRHIGMQAFINFSFFAMIQCYLWLLSTMPMVLSWFLFCTGFKIAREHNQQYDG
jgi:hypothetical protein